MKPRITVITVGVDDLERAVTFYRDGLGLQTDGIMGSEISARRCRLLPAGEQPHAGRVAAR